MYYNHIKNYNLIFLLKYLKILHIYMVILYHLIEQLICFNI